MGRERIKAVAGIILAAVLLTVTVSGLVFRLNRFKIVFSEPTGKTDTVEYGGEYTVPQVKAFLVGKIFYKSGKEIKTSKDLKFDTKTLGSYKLSWSASAAGINGSFVRTVNVVDTTPPVITLNPASKSVMYSDEKYVEPGFSATDAVDGDVTAKVIASGIDTKKVGESQITYTVTDNNGNTATAVRKVTVKERPKPVTPPVVSPTVSPGSAGVIYLTFDDGPGAHTARLLDILKKYNVKATFFVTGGGDRSLIAREAQEGHSVGIHSFSHVYSNIYSSDEAFFADINTMNEIIKEQTGSYTNILRFPGGGSNTVSAKYNAGIMTRLTAAVGEKGFKYFDWNVVSGDAGGTKSADKVYSNVINGIRGKSYAIVLQHDIKGFSVNAVERIIVWGLNNGYTFAPLNYDSPTVHQRLNN